MGKDQEFCCVGNFSVMVPYRDLEKLLEIGNKYEALLQRLDRLEDRLTSLQGIQSEIIEKIGEIQRFL